MPKKTVSVGFLNNPGCGGMKMPQIHFWSMNDGQCDLVKRICLHVINKPNHFKYLHVCEKIQCLQTYHSNHVFRSKKSRSLMTFPEMNLDLVFFNDAYLSHTRIHPCLIEDIYTLSNVHGHALIYFLQTM